MIKRNFSNPLTGFFACLAIPATAFLLMAFSEKEYIVLESPGKIVTDTIPSKKHGMVRDDDTRPLTLFDGEEDTNTKPLILVDGEEVPEIKSLKPDDIASISVLKGGKAMDFYASRGKNGVILITTKKGVNIQNESRLFKIDTTPYFLHEGKIFPVDSSINPNQKKPFSLPYKPLYIVDGEEVSNIDHINPSEIESISVLKNESAKVFGEKGKNGVVMITMKKE